MNEWCKVQRVVPPNSSLLFSRMHSDQCSPYTEHNAMFQSLSSYVAALSAPRLQFSPQTDHVLWGLVVCSEITIKATRLVESDIMQILHRLTSAIELLNPHAHTLTSSILNNLSVLLSNSDRMY
uniref:Uncharacterized protein n=1 Tax=Arundo donax TaxID=35708 RepID=A0A0A9G0C2_ARUDO